MRQAYIITGTDTEVGKTFVTCLLLDTLQSNGRHCFGLKPIAAGGVVTEQGIRNEDALALQHRASITLDYATINPYCFESPIAPHIAAGRAGVQLEADALVRACNTALDLGFAEAPDAIALIEGAGGWHVPLNDVEYLSDVAVRLRLPVILVVSMKLGCLNHAKLTADAIVAGGLTLAGWVANQPGPEKMPFFEENIKTMKGLVEAPCLGVVPYMAELATSADRAGLLNIDDLL